MKNIYYILIFLGASLSNSISAQDIMRGRIDTLICSEFTPELYFQTVYDTSAYDSEWFMFGEDLAFSDLDSIMINDIDSLLLHSVPNSDPDSVYIDTLYFSIRFTPEINLEVPIAACFDGDSLTIIDLTNTFGDYTTVDYELEGEDQFASMDSLIKVFVDNGDSTTLIVNYVTLGCPTIFDTIELKTDFQPISDFDFLQVCFGDSTTIINQSDFDITIAMFSLHVEDLDSFNVAQDSFDVFLPINGDARDVFVELTQGNCTRQDTFQISNKLQPDASFDAPTVCENDFLEINNLSIDTTINSNSTYSFTINNFTSNFINSSVFTLSDTLADSTYTAIGVVDNENGCIDSFTWQLDIDSVTYVSFDSLLDAYCERQDTSLLLGNLESYMVGEFKGDFVTDLGNGTALFYPTSPSSNISVTYSYTNEFGCLDSDAQVVSTVHPKPKLVLEGLDDEYCALDSTSQLTLSDTLGNSEIASNSTYNIVKNGISTTTLISLDYEFEPIDSGVYIFENIYQDINGCRDTITNETKVNPLPTVEVDQLIIITPGESIEIGNLNGAENNVNYTWSDGSIFSSLDIDLPGIYIIQAINDTTLCTARDTAKVEYDDTYKESQLVEITISPNPTQEFVEIQLTTVVQNILIFDVFGEPVTIGGVSIFGTDNNGYLRVDLSSPNQRRGYYYIIIPDIGNFLIVKI